MSNFMDVILSMIKEGESDYNLLNNKICINLLNDYFKQLEESYSLYKIRNFPVFSPTEEFIIPLRCVINNKPINIPAKTTSCLHIEFMELQILLNFILKNGNCPLCVKEVNKTKEGFDANSNINSKEKVGVDKIFIDCKMKEIFKLINRNKNISKNSDPEFAFNILPFEFIIINKQTLKWKPYDPRRTNLELNKKISLLFSCNEADDDRKNKTSIELIELSHEENENPNLLELKEMNDYLGQESNKIEFQLATILDKFKNKNY